MTETEILAQLRSDLSPHRFQHTLNVATTAETLAPRFRIDPAQARLAGILHDCAKHMDFPAMLRLTEEMGIETDAQERSSLAIMHAPAGRARAEREFGVNDQDILAAIRTHTIGGVDLSPLQKLIYVSDFIEPGRQPFPGLTEVRRLAESDLDAAVMAAARLTLSYVASRAETAHPSTIAMLKKMEETKMNETLELANKIAHILDEKKAEDIQILRVDHLTSITDYFVIASGRSAQAVHALYEEVTDKLAEEGITPRRNDGVRESRWIVLDYASVIVHLFHPEERQYYNIERLWADGTNHVPFASKG